MVRDVGPRTALCVEPGGGATATGQEEDPHFPTTSGSATLESRLTTVNTSGKALVGPPLGDEPPHISTNPAHLGFRFRP